MLSTTELELAATEADRERCREIMDELESLCFFRMRTVFCDECMVDLEIEVDADERREVEFAILRGLVAHRLAAEARK